MSSRPDHHVGFPLCVEKHWQSRGLFVLHSCYVLSGVLLLTVRCSGQSVTASDFGSNGPRFESGRGRCVESLDKALYSHCSKAFTLASISYLAILVKYILAKKKKKNSTCSFFFFLICLLDCERRTWTVSYANRLSSRIHQLPCNNWKRISSGLTFSACVFISSQLCLFTITKNVTLP